MNTLLLYTQRTSNIDDDLFYKKAAINQECFIRDVIGHLCKANIFVVSHHYSKSVYLPVYAFTMRNGVSIICRNNFYDWKVSVKLPAPLPLNYFDKSLLSSFGFDGDDISEWYCEGFKREWVYKSYKPNDPNYTEFTVEVYDDYRFYTMMYLLTKAFDNIVDINISCDTKEEIISYIDEIYKANGKYEYKDYDNIIPDKIVTRLVMKGWEILDKTHSKLSEILRTFDRYDDFGVMDDPEALAEWIYNYPELKEVFMSELYQFMYNF